MAVEITKEKNYIILKSNEKSIKKEDFEIINKNLHETNDLPENVIIDLSQTKSVGAGALPHLIKIVSYVSSRNRKFSLISSKEIYDFIIKQGVDRLIPCYPNMAHISQSNLSSSDQTTEFLNTVISSMQNTMKTYLESDVIVNAPRVLTSSDTVPDFNIGAVVGIVSSQFNGSLFLGFSNEVFLKIVSAFLGMEVTSLNPQVQDTAAELLNVVLGQVKIKLNEKGYSIQQAIPSVIYGENVKLNPTSDMASIVIPVSSGLGDFFIRIVLQQG